MLKLFVFLITISKLVVIGSFAWIRCVGVITAIGVIFVYLDAYDTHIKNALIAFNNDLNVWKAGGWPGKFPSGHFFFVISYFGIYYSVFHKNVIEEWNTINCKPKWIYVLPLIFCIARAVFVFEEGTEFRSLAEYFGYVVLISVAPGILVGAAIDIFLKLDENSRLVSGQSEKKFTYSFPPSVIRLLDLTLYSFRLFFSSFVKYKDFSGRANRAEFWIFQIFCGVVTFALLPIDKNFHVLKLIGTLENIAFVLFLVPSLAVTTRRLHDTNRSGWWIGIYTFVLILYKIYFDFFELLSHILILIFLSVNTILLVYFLCCKGDQGNNRYG
jgi:uncharacterized membrane protein YhaH (DUF805 family)